MCKKYTRNWTCMIYDGKVVSELKVKGESFPNWATSTTSIGNFARTDVTAKISASSAEESRVFAEILHRSRTG